MRKVEVDIIQSELLALIRREKTKPDVTTDSGMIGAGEMSILLFDIINEERWGEKKWRIYWIGFLAGRLHEIAKSSGGNSGKKGEEY